MGIEVSGKRLLGLFLSLLALLFGHGMLGVPLLHESGERGVEHLLGQSVLFGSYVHVVGERDEVVADDFDFFFVVYLALYPDVFQTGILDGHGVLFSELGSCLHDYLAGDGIDRVLRKYAAYGPLHEPELLVVFVTADLSQIVALRIEEQSLDEIVGALERGRFTRP